MSNLRSSDDKTRLSLVNLIMHTHLSQFWIDLELLQKQNLEFIFLQFSIYFFQYISCVLKPVLLSACYGTQNEWLSKEFWRFSVKNNKFPFIPHFYIAIWLGKSYLYFLVLFFGAFHCIKDILLNVFFGIPQNVVEWHVGELWSCWLIACLYLNI